MCDAEFWKQVPPNEPYRVILGDVRDKLYQTRERTRQLLAHGHSDVPEEATFTNVEQVIMVFHFLCPFLIYKNSSINTHDCNRKRYFKSS